MGFQIVTAIGATRRMGLAAALAFAIGCSVLTDLEVLSRDRDLPPDGPGADAALGVDGPSGSGEAGFDATGDAGMSYRDLILSEGPVAYWRLGEQPGDIVARDETGNGNDGNYVGVNLGALGAIAGDSNTAVAIDGNGRVDVGDKLDFTGNTPMSLEAWISLSGAQTPGIIAKGGWRLFFWSGGIRFDHSGDVYCPCIAFEEDGGAVKDGVYHHIVASYDKITMRIYYDGVRAQQCECASTLPDDDAGVTLGFQLSGKLDEAVVYDRVLAEPEVKQHYEAGRGIASK